MSVTFADIRAMVSQIEEWHGVPPENFRKLAKNLALDAATQSALGVFSAAQNAAWPAIKHPRVAFYACARAGDGATERRLQDLAEGKDAALRFCALANADLRVYELDMTKPDSSEAALAHALSYGLMAVDDHVDILVVDSVAEDFTFSQGGDPLTALRAQDEAAILGAALGARLAKIPVLVAPALCAPLQKAVAALAPDGKADFIITLPDAQTASWPRGIQALAALMKLKTALALLPESGKNSVQISQAA